MLLEDCWVMAMVEPNGLRPCSSLHRWWVLLVVALMNPDSWGLGNDRKERFSGENPPGLIQTPPFGCCFRLRFGSHHPIFLQSTLEKPRGACLSPYLKLEWNLLKYTKTHPKTSSESQVLSLIDLDILDCISKKMIQKSQEHLAKFAVERLLAHFRD